MHSNEVADTGNHPAETLVVSGVLAIWLALVFLLGSVGVFVRPPGSWPIPILIGVVAPLTTFLAGFRASRAFRDFVLSVDLGLITGIQA